MNPPEPLFSAMIDTAIDIIKRACANGHYWSKEQQTDHTVCAWCGACDGSCK